MALTPVALHGPDIETRWRSLAELRIRIFREFPYLYKGNLDYERDYLQTYIASPRSLALLLLDGEAVVGATTALPLAEEGPEFREPFERPEDYFYFGESLLLPAYRGQGYGHLFFDRREAWARQLGYRQTCFCAVERPDDHPARPADYRPLHDFWRARGYVHQPERRCQFHWLDVGEAEETAKPMSFWIRVLVPSL